MVQNVCIVEISAGYGPLVVMNNIINGTGTETSTGVGGKGYAREVVLNYQNGMTKLPGGLTASGIQPTDCRDDWNFRLQMLVNQTAGLKEECYTKETWTVYIASLRTANNILGEATPSTAAIRQAYNELDNAINGLIKKSGHHCP